MLVVSFSKKYLIFTVLAAPHKFTIVILMVLEQNPEVALKEQVQVILLMQDQLQVVLEQVHI